MGDIYGVKLVLEGREGIVLTVRDGKVSLPFSLSRGDENPMGTAARMAGEIAGGMEGLVRALPVVERESVSAVEPSLRFMWPGGLRTYAVYTFHASAPSRPSLDGHYYWVSVTRSLSILSPEELEVVLAAFSCKE